MMKRFVTRSLLFLFLVYALSTVLSWGYTALFTDHKSDQSKKNWVLLRLGDSCDYAILGSSRVFHMINVPLLNKLTGKKGINIGNAGSSYADNYALLIKYLEKNYINTLVLNADEFSFNSSKHYTYPFKDFQYMPYFFEDSINLIYKENVPAWKYYLWSTVSLSRYIEFNEYYDLGSLAWLTTQKPVSAYDKTLGTELLTNLKYRKFKTADTTGIHPEKFVLDKKDLRYFYKIINLCKSKGIAVILVTPPIYCKGMYAKESRLKITQFIEGLAKEQKLYYVNFYKVKKLCNVLYFRDLSHTNYWGTNIYTRYLAQELKVRL